jgi:hypothetical protein
MTKACSCQHALLAALASTSDKRCVICCVPVLCCAVLCCAVLCPTGSWQPSHRCLQSLSKGLLVVRWPNPTLQILRVRLHQPCRRFFRRAVCRGQRLPCGYCFQRRHSSRHGDRSSGLRLCSWSWFRNRCRPLQAVPCKHVQPWRVHGGVHAMWCAQLAGAGLCC